MSKNYHMGGGAPDVPLRRALLAWVLALAGMLLMAVVLDLWQDWQLRGTAPAYTCAPGQPYTTAECP